jgi:hypothetical protein
MGDAELVAAAFIVAQGGAQSINGASHQYPKTAGFSQAAVRQRVLSFPPLCKLVEVT